MIEKQEMELYIHIPFCVKKCNYCDFLSFPSGEETREAYCAALGEELRETAEFAKDFQIRSIFIGGGTPSLFSPKQIEKIFQEIYAGYSVFEQAEISIEANPGTITKEKLAAYQAVGINRLSIGLQSTDNVCLKRLGRIHTYEEFLSNYELARKIGFSNMNIDLMSALPGQSLSGYLATLKAVTDLRPEHISSYSLILEEGTPFYHSREVEAILPDEDTERKMYEKTKEKLQQEGYGRYEISNYALPGKECLHNLGYWDEVPYLGVGLGASSCFLGARFANESTLANYIRRPFVPFREREDYQPQTLESRMEEYMYLGLRKCEGVSLSRFVREFGIRMEKVYGGVLTKYEKLGLLRRQGDWLFLTDAGIDVSNHIFSEFLL